MVTASEARTQLTTQRAAVESQRQQIRQRTQQAPLSAVAVRAQTRASIAQRQVQAKQLEGIRSQALQTLKPVTQELDKFESEIANIEGQLRKEQERQAAFRTALDVFRSGDPEGVFGLSGVEEDFFRQISQGKTKAIQEAFKKQQKEIELQGFKPIFVDGELRGIEDLITKQSRTLEDIKPIIIEGKLVGFEDIALQLSRQLRVPIPITIAPPERITFGQPEKFAESFRQATGATSFTLAIPIKRENGKLRVQDFNFRFENGELVRSKQTGTALLTEAQFLAADKRRRERNPGFTFGSTLLVAVGEPLLTVEAAPDLTGRLQESIIQNTPELRFIGQSRLANITREAIGAGVGTQRFVESEFSKVLSDPRGKFKFTPIQADRISGLLTEVATGFVAGAAVGKAVTLIRGAGSKLLPRALTGSPTFQRTTNILGGLGVITLTVAQGVSVKNTFEKEGIDAAIQQLAGFVSFGVGFSVTGLRSLPRAEAEFKAVTDLLKKTVPAGKRGELIRRKRKKGEVSVLEGLTEEEIAEGQANLGALERRIAEAKTPKEQAKIIAELSKRLKGKNARKNFQEFLLTLIEKEIIKVPLREIVPGVKARVVPRREGVTVTFPRVKKPGRLREVNRIKRNRAREVKRIQRSKLTLGQRFRIAQGLATSTGISAAVGLGVASSLTQAQRSAQITKQRQRIIQRQRVGSRLVLAQRSASKLALRSLLKSSFKTGLRLKPRFKPPKLKAPPLIPLPKKKIKKKIPTKAIPFEITGKSFNVLVRKKGEFVKIASSLPENRAKRRLLRVLDRTLAASGRIVPSKLKPIKEDIKKLNIPQAFFRRPVPGSPLRKANTFTIIERRSKRLNTRSEVKAIQQARRFKRV